MNVLSQGQAHGPRFRGGDELARGWHSFTRSEVEHFGSAGGRGARNYELWWSVIYLTFSAPLFCEIAVDYAPGGVRCPVLDNATERQRRCRMPEF